MGDLHEGTHAALNLSRRIPYINLLSQKVDSVLATVRNLRQEVAGLKQALAGANAELQDKTMLLEVMIDPDDLC